MNHPWLQYTRLVSKRWLVVVWALVLGGCTEANPGATCADGTCSDPDFPYCDVDGSVSGAPGSCVAVSCTPGEIKECRGEKAFTCSADGRGYEVSACDLGCADAPSPHCKYLQPKYLPSVCDDAAAADSLLIDSSGSLDPNVDTTCTGGVISQGAADLCVVRAKTITIGASSTLTIVGSKLTNGRSIAFVADETLDVLGTLDVSGGTGTNGPGGGTFASGGQPSANTMTGQTFAGGGAGGAAAGGAGGLKTSTGGVNGGATNGGAATMNPALLASFVGGASSFRLGDSPDAPDPSFGGGGGGLLLVSCHGTVNVSGTINAGGGGGDGGFIYLLGFPGRGGGAGGNVVIEGRNVTVTGQLFANGGGGGEGWRSAGPGADGKTGEASDTAGGAGGDSLENAGNGGAGGWVGNNALAGAGPSDSLSGPGGGGGSVGFLQTYTPSGVTPTLTPSHVSPAFQPNGTVELR